MRPPLNWPSPFFSFYVLINTLISVLITLVQQFSIMVLKPFRDYLSHSLKRVCWGKNVLKSNMVMTAQLCKYTKNYLVIYWNLWQLNYASIKPIKIDFIFKTFYQDQRQLRKLMAEDLPYVWKFLQAIRKRHQTITWIHREKLSAKTYKFCTILLLD